MLISTIKLQLQSNQFENHLATMASLGKIPVFTGEDYAYWKVRMRAFLQSMGTEVWEITKNQTYEVLAVRTSPLQVSEHEANAKAINALFAGVSRAEFSRVQGFSGSPQCLDVP